jgi:hypothetical protein
MPVTCYATVVLIHRGSARRESATMSKKNKKSTKYVVRGVFSSADFSSDIMETCWLPLMYAGATGMQWTLKERYTMNSSCAHVCQTAGRLLDEEVHITATSTSCPAESHGCPA